MRIKENNIAERYMKEIYSAIKCRKIEKYFFLKGLSNSVYTYVMDHPEATLEALYVEFGSPEQFANGILTRADYVKMFKSAKIKATICKCVIIVAVVVTIAVIVCMFTCARHAILANSGVSNY